MENRNSPSKREQIKMRRRERRKEKKQKKKEQKKKNKAKMVKVMNKIEEKEKYRVKHEKEARIKYASLKKDIKRMIRNKIIRYAHEHSTYQIMKLKEVEKKTLLETRELEEQIEQMKYERKYSTSMGYNEEESDEESYDDEEEEEDDTSSSEDEDDLGSEETESYFLNLKDKETEKTSLLKHKALKFENFEWYGDLVLDNRIGRRIYQAQGQIATPHVLSTVKSLSVENVALSRIFDLLELDEVVKMNLKKKQSDIVKQKGDVIEAIIGELTNRVEKESTGEEKELINIFLEKLYDIIYNLGNVIFYELQQLGDEFEEESKSPSRSRSPNIKGNSFQSRKRNASVPSKRLYSPRHTKSPKRKTPQHSPKKSRYIQKYQQKYSPKKRTLSPIRGYPKSENIQHSFHTYKQEESNSPKQRALSPIRGYPKNENIQHSFHTYKQDKPPSPIRGYPKNEDIRYDFHTYEKEVIQNEPKPTTFKQKNVIFTPLRSLSPMRQRKESNHFLQQKKRHEFEPEDDSNCIIS